MHIDFANWIGWREFVREAGGESFDANGRFFLFLSGEPRTGDGSELFARDERRGWLRRAPAEPVQLTSGPTRWNAAVAGKDGRTILADGVNLRGELSRVNVQTHSLQPFLGGVSAEGVTFSRDGRSVAYSSYPENALFVANADGSNPVQLTDPQNPVFLPRWSPDGSQLLYVDRTTTGQNEIFLISAKGGNPHILMPKDEEPKNNPGWSADGSEIVFDSPDPRFSKDPNCKVHVFSVKSGQITTLPDSQGLYSPRWSPDGAWIAAISIRDSSSLRLFDIKSQRWSKLFENFQISFPEWSRDSRFVYFWHANGDERGLYRIRAKGGKPELVNDLKDWRLTGWFGGWMGLDATDTPLVLRDIGSDDIYALTLDEK